MFSTDFHGNSEIGEEFNDSSIIKDVNNEALTKIVLHHDQFIDSITVRLSISISVGAS